jgi:spectinomycin phosphotransferase
VRSLPADLDPERLAAALAEGWHLNPASMDYVPEGGGSHHWKMAGEDGVARFVTVDDLDDKDWLGDTREAVFDGLGRALSTAVALRDWAALDFVVAPLATRDGGLLRRVESRYAVCVFPFLAGRSGRLWAGGPFSEPARRLLVTRTADLARLAAGFDRLAAATATVRADLVITHGEPHPANLMSVQGRPVLIDWDTAALAPPERDVSLIATTSGEGMDRYQHAVGRDLDRAVITLYRSRWYLDDLASAILLFRSPHRDTPDTRR